MTRIEEIKQRLEAWVHWQMEAGRSIDETHVPDMRFLLEEIERLNRVLANELSENDDLGAEYSYVNALKGEIARLSMELVEARKQRDQRRDEAVRLRAALGAYADESFWEYGCGCCCVPKDEDGHRDWDQLGDRTAGDLARRTLSDADLSSSTALDAVRQAQRCLDHMCMMVDEPEKYEAALAQLEKQFGRSG